MVARPQPSPPAESQVDVWRIGLALPLTPTAADPDGAYRTGGAATRDAGALSRTAGRDAGVVRATGRQAFSRSANKFNLSHCTDTALLEVTAATEVGVDIERLRAIDR